MMSRISIGRDSIVVGDEEVVVGAAMMGVWRGIRVNDKIRRGAKMEIGKERDATGGQRPQVLLLSEGRTCLE